MLSSIAIPAQNLKTIVQYATSKFVSKFAINVHLIAYLAFLTPSTINMIERQMRNKRGSAAITRATVSFNYI